MFRLFSYGNAEEMYSNDGMKPRLRKQIRLKEYDYSENGAYFLTICTRNRKRVFWNVGATCGRLAEVQLSPAGEIVLQEIQKLDAIYDTVRVDKYCIMPNHIHLLLCIQTEKERRPQVAPTVSRIVQQFKGVITKKLGRPIWQKSFYDHVVRNDADYLACWQYIDNNPRAWQEDELYEKE